MLKAVLIGFGITVACAAVPILHFVTIWPGPFIGGFVAGSRMKATPRQGLAIGVFMAVLMVAPIYLILLGVDALFDLFGEGGPGLLLAGGGLIGLYVGMLGALGAVMGGGAAQRQGASSGS